MANQLSGAIIAAGRGARLRPAIADLPKPLADVGGETLLARQVRLMLGLGLARVYVIINSETSRLMNAMGLRLPDQTDLHVADTPNSMESLLHLGKSIPAERFLLTTVDLIVDEDEFQRFFRRALNLTASGREGGFAGALGVVKWRGDKKPLFVTVAADGRILNFGDQGERMVTAGAYLFSSRIFDYSGEARVRGLVALRQYLALLVERGMALGTVPMNGVIDVDEAPDLEAARNSVARGFGGGALK
jgi:NDP-sugar pyrophosphorylase family protein